MSFSRAVHKHLKTFMISYATVVFYVYMCVYVCDILILYLYYNSILIFDIIHICNYHSNKYNSYCYWNKCQLLPINVNSFMF